MDGPYSLTETTDEPAPRSPRGRGSTVLVIVALLVGLGGAGVAAQQRQVAAGWQDRALTIEEQRDDARGRTEALQSQLDEVAGSLSVSEDDVASLEGRVRELADEVAQAEDVATTTGVERDTLVALSSAVAGSISSLDTCVDELFDLLNEAIEAFNRQGGGESVDVGPLNADRTATTASCNAAKSSAASASSDAQQLLR